MGNLLSRWWWKYVWHCWRGDGQKYSSMEKPATTWGHFRCRVNGHKCGAVWFNAGGLEPDMRCQDCGDNLG